MNSAQMLKVRVLKLLLLQWQQCPLFLYGARF
jgi:hypothetical protein